MSRVYKISYPTAWDWVNRYRTTGNYSSKQGVGCGRELTFTDKQAILDYIEANPDTDGILDHHFQYDDKVEMCSTFANSWHT